MKKLLFLLFIIMIVCLDCEAQDRVDKKPAGLSYKSKEITAALYWQENNETGRWESRKNTKLIYLGQGVAIDNFNSLFIGEYKGMRYLFLDYCKYSWRYPNLRLDWKYSTTIMQALLTDEDYNGLSSIAAGETLKIKPRFYHAMSKRNIEYSFPFFLMLGETQRSSSETLYRSYKTSIGENYAERQWKEEYPSICFMMLRRVIGSDGRDVVQFNLYPGIFSELFDKSYFEVEYSVYRNLFTEDKKQSYK